MKNPTQIKVIIQGKQGIGKTIVAQDIVEHFIEDWGAKAINLSDGKNHSRKEIEEADVLVDID